MSTLPSKVWWQVRWRLNRRKYRRIYSRFRDFTMIHESAFVTNLEIVKRFSTVPGAIVECGTWKGGMSAGMAAMLGDRKYYLFDSYEGLPPPQPIDGKAAQRFVAGKDAPGNYNNNTAAEDDARKAMSGVKDVIIKKGWFKDTLPGFVDEIAILRMDGDWYESTMDILNNLFWKVVPGGVIIIDDYYDWEGCAKAVHDFLSANKRSERIHERFTVCYIVKEPEGGDAPRHWWHMG